MRAVNLLPTDLRASDRKGAKPVATAAPEGRPVGAYAILGGLTAVVAAVAVATSAGNAVKGHERELADVKAEQAIAQAEVDRLAPYGSFRDVAVQRTQTVRQLADSRFDWEQTLRDLSRAIPSDVTLSSITGTVTSGTTTASVGSSNPLRSAIQAPAIELSGCASSQAGVARLMARLRAVQGVTRVSLASSAKQEETAGSGVGDSAGSSKAEGCGKGSPPTFELVTFFEGAKAASAAPATASAATASATATPSAGATPAAGAATGQAAAAATPAPAASTPTPTAPATGATQEASTK
jgi:Tfp pilus assembly protein PilN